MRGTRKIISQVDAIVQNPLLAESLCQSIDAGLSNPYVYLMGKKVWEVFKYSLDASIRNIETHPRGDLFRRFLDYGPPNPDDPKKLTSDRKTILSDPECGECVQFIFSHMVNRFKGELAELLAIYPCLELIKQLQVDGVWPKKVGLYLGDTIQERRRIKQKNRERWGDFTKGADGLVVNKMNGKSRDKQIDVCGIIEVKSMPRSENKLRGQIKHHLDRMRGGLKLDGHTWDKKQIQLDFPVYIMVVPSNWKLDRECYYEDGHLVYPNDNKPPTSTRLDKTGRNHWKITLDWSKEALEQAAYEMTYWYMSQVGTTIYKNKPLPKGWEGMSAEEAGYNAIKMMLYYVMLRYITPQQARRATKLYNAYSFGYPLAMDAKDMLWPEDIRNQDKE